MIATVENLFIFTLKFKLKKLWREYQIFMCRDASISGSLSEGIIDESLILDGYRRILFNAIMSYFQHEDNDETENSTETESVNSEYCSSETENDISEQYETSDIDTSFCSDTETNNPDYYWINTPNSV